MEWRASIAGEKLRFIAAYEPGEIPMTALCARFGVSRQAGAAQRRAAR